MGFDELVQHDASELTNGTLPSGRLPASGSFSDSLLVGSTGAATNALGVSGGAVVGSGFAGSSTAPTNGALFEGGVGFGTTSVSGAATFGGDVFQENLKDFVLGDTTKGTFRLTTNFQVISDDPNGSTMGIGRYESNTSFGSILTFAKSRSGSTGDTGGAVQLGDDMFAIEASGDDGNGNIVRAAAIRSQVDGTVSSGVVPARIFVETMTSGGSVNTALRIDSAQDVQASNRMIVNTSIPTSPVNALDVDGAAVIGSGFAGSNTAPTDGLLVEGKIEMSSNGAGIFVNSNGDVVAVDDSGNTSVLT